MLRQNLRRRAGRRSGFTLLELVIVLAVLGIIAAIGIPTYNTIQANAVGRTVLSTSQAIVRNANAIAASSTTLGGSVDRATLWAAASEAYTTTLPAWTSLTGAVTTWTASSNLQSAVIGTTTATGLRIMLTSGSTCKAVLIAAAVANVGQVSVTSGPSDCSSLANPT